jgi:hypothetical protein
MAVKAMLISTATPKNVKRPEMPPKKPPMSGPAATPSDLGDRARQSGHAR